MVLGRGECKGRGEGSGWMSWGVLRGNCVCVLFVLYEYRRGCKNGIDGAARLYWVYVSYTEHEARLSVSTVVLC